MYRFQNGRVVVQSGRLADIGVDALVRPVGGARRVAETIEHGLVDAGGDALVEVLNGLTPPSAGEVVVGDAAGLRAERLVHLGLPCELEQAYERALRAAFEHGATSVAVPLLEGGRDDDAATCIAVVAAFLEAHPSMERVVVWGQDEVAVSRVLAVTGEYF